MVGNGWVTLKTNLFSIWPQEYHWKEKKEAGPELLRPAEFIAAARVHEQREQEHLSAWFEALRIWEVSWRDWVFPDSAGL